MFDWCIKHGVQVAVFTLLICVLGIAAALRIPVQMIPDLEVRTISVVTEWPGATPQDVEQEILIQQEDYLSTVTGVSRMISNASTGEASIELEFPSSVDVNDALIRVINALSQVPSYPENVDEPRVYASSFSENAFMYYGVYDTSGSRTPEEVLQLRDFIDNRVRPRMERVPGVSQVSVSGAPERQIQIRIDLARLSSAGLTLEDVRSALRDRNNDISAGDIDEGKRRYLVRTVGRSEDPTDLAKTVLKREGDAVTTLGDVATIRLGLYEARGRSYQDGRPTIRLSVSREVGSNVIEIKEAMTEAVESINQQVLAPVDLELIKTTDDVRYVEASVANVWRNLIVGAIAATVVLFLFLRSFSATAICVIGIPACTIAAFIGLLAAGRTINVISLAGVAFAIGMTLDNAIVVLESIEKQRRAGHNPLESALRGVREVWSSVLASTMTTVIVFAPVWLIEEEAGQLFSDISIAISASIIASMLVAISVIPTASVHLKKLGVGTKNKNSKGVYRYFTVMVRRLSYSRGWAAGGIGIVAIVSGSILYWLTPPAEYLPEGEEAKIFARVIAPPGYNLETMDALAQEVHDQFLPYLKSNSNPGDRPDESIPEIEWFLVNVSGESLFIIGETVDPARIDDLSEALSDFFKDYPGIRNFNSRGSIISSNDGGSRSVNLDISGPGLAEIYAVAEAAYRRAQEIFEGPEVNSEPSALTLQQPMVEVIPDWEHIAELGFSNEAFGYSVAALTDGAFVDEFILDGERIDVFLSGQGREAESLDELSGMPLYAPVGGVTTVGAVADLVERVDTASIRRLNGDRTVTLNIIPPPDVALETAVNRVQSDLVEALREEGIVPEGVTIDVTGAGDQLQETRESLTGNFLIALILSYLLLTAVFSHWGYPLIILATVPIGIAGGIGGLWILNLAGTGLSWFGFGSIYQPFDMITMLGFLILLGTVVNNPILIVTRTIDALKEGADLSAAIEDATLSRLRPILMSTTTTVVGILPLVLFPGAGTELYRGVGAIVLFGLLFSTVVTLVFLPSLLHLLLTLVQKITGRPAGG
ncbi:efflux RND transporter permease subunit [Puniceicoccus vermicola]|uniref:Efflux RND transporter permease subunit n=1 Tax=Puniceicoccus vermicola TaxID=388746 RepID=A0A7X1E4T6_9BACT|nr:efflux RND transporter permease subunit [Puniceicoccus vermicola]MBC2602358.1 efflux RND transporter permease subunit [Puniceicoccus vermicola]